MAPRDPAAAGVVGTAVVTKMRSPQTTGDENPRPGTVAFQAIRSVLFQVSGASPRAIPSFEGPRQAGQSASPATMGGDQEDEKVDESGKDSYHGKNLTWAGGHRTMA